MIRALLLLLSLAGGARAETVVLGLSQDEVAITATYDGSDILVFGAVKREAAIPQGAPLQVIVTVAGPAGPVTVRRKERRGGIWVNAASARVSSAPVFYAVASSAPLSKALNHFDDAVHRISITQAVRSVLVPEGTENAAGFADALIRLKTNEGLYLSLEDAVKVDQQTLFRSRIRLPANLTEGIYEARIFLTRDGKVIDTLSTPIPVQKVGVERFLFSLAQTRAALYGLMSLAIAVAAGWIASWVFGRLSR